MNIMNIIIYISILGVGVTFGSFFTLAVHRIPRKENITYMRSYCPNCEHKLNFWDLIPVFSYIFLKAKCRYCENKIRIRYFLLEIFSGLVFLLVAYTRKISFESAIPQLIELAITYLFIACIFINAGIDKEKKEIPNGLIIYGLSIGIINFAYKIFIGQEIFTNIIGLTVIPIFIFIINLLIGILYKDENKFPVGMGDIKYIAIIGLFLGFGAQVIILILSVLIMFIGISINLIKSLIKNKSISSSIEENNLNVDKIKYKTETDVEKCFINNIFIPWGYYLSISTIIIIISINYISDIIELIERA